jgi:lysophospholipase L1-like esterase
MRIAIVGDSHSEVWGPQMKKRLEEDGHQVVYSSYKRGWSTQSYLNDSGFASSIRAASPEVVVVGLGGNNRDLDYNSYSQKVSQMARLLRDAGGQEIVWLSPAEVPDGQRGEDVDKRHRETRNLQEGIMPTLGIRWVDMYPVSQTNHQSSTDVHFTREGYRKWVDHAYPVVQGAIAGTTPRASSFPIAGVSALAVAGFLLWKRL